jgi:hypothetical protein
VRMKRFRLCTSTGERHSSGVTFTELTEDFDRTKRPTNWPSDIGAFQFLH